MNTIVVLLLALGASALVLTAATHAAVLIVRRRRSGVSPLPSISVLKPVKGNEPGLYENLRALAEQDYPSFELVIGAEDPADAALPVARRLQRDFPHVRIRVVAGARPLGCNAKVTNLSMLSEYAEHDWVLVSDSSVRPERGYLRALAAELADPRVGLVTSTLVGVGGEGIGAALDNLLLNTMAVRAISAAELFAGHPCVIGKSMLFRLSELKRLGGFGAVSDVLAEDYVLGQMFHRAGLRVALSAHALPTLSAQRTLADFCSRHLRWAQMRRHLAPVYWFEPLLTPLPWLSGAVVAAAMGNGPLQPETVLTLAAAGLCLRLVSDAHLQRLLTGRRLDAEGVLLSLLKDAVLLAVWVLAVFRRRVSWRGNDFVIGPGSRLQPAQPRIPLLASGV
jgi:ceramide glucosyltransferase